MRRAIKRIEMRGYNPNYGHYVAYARPPRRIHRAVPSHKDRQVALRRLVAARNQARRIPRAALVALAETPPAKPTPRR